MLRRLLIATTSLFVVTSLLTASPAEASAGDSSWQLSRDGHDGRDRDRDRNRHDRDHDRGVRTIPEFDPAAVGAIAAVLAGGALVVARRKKN